MLNDSLESFAAAIIAAEAVATQAVAALAEADSHRSKIAERISGLKADRAEIIARRTAGDVRPDDGARLALAGADAEGLAGMLPGADAAVAMAHHQRQEAVAALAGARAAYVAEEHRLALAKLDAHAGALISALHATLQQRHAATSALPAAARGYNALTGLLAAIDPVMTAALAELRGAIPFREIAYAAHPTWMPSDDLYANVFRLHNLAGRFN